MDSQDRNAIEELFEKLARVERQSAPRDAEAEAFIRAQTAVQPGAPYYMAQTVIVQEQALNAAQQRIAELERETGEAESGVLGGMFGRGRAREPAYGQRRRQEPWGSSRGAGDGFLAGAAQTAMGVAGGVLLGSMLADWLSPDAAEAAGAEEGEAGLFEDQADMSEVPAEVPADGGDFGGDMDFGDF